MFDSTVSTFGWTVAAAMLCSATTLYAAGPDMSDPRRALALDDGVRIDAQLTQDALSSSASLHVIYQVENLTSAAVAIADKVSDISYDSDTQTITLTVGTEIPNGGVLPHLVVIPAGEKKVFSCGGLIHASMAAAHMPWGRPRYVQIKVNVLRDVTPFRDLIEAQTRTPAQPLHLRDDKFEKWIQGTDSIALNTLPVHWNADRDDN